MAGSNGLVLITGINGYIASVTAKWFLDAGYTVRGTARSRESSVQLLRASFGDFIDNGRLEIVEVKDITVEGAFDEAVKDVTVIAHLASPVSMSFKAAEPVLHAATQGTLCVLTSAHKYAGSQLKTVIFMSSVSAITKVQEAPHRYSESEWATDSLEKVKQLGDAAGGVQIYKASKVAGEQAFWKFDEDHKPGWNMAAVNPAFVCGPPLNLTNDPSKIHDTVVNVWLALSGQKPVELGGSGSFVDVRDVARILVWIAENPTAANGERYLAVGGYGHVQKIMDILNKHYPQRKGIIPVGDLNKTYPPNDGFPEGSNFFENTKVPKATGQGWISYEQSVVDSAKAFERYL